MACDPVCRLKRLAPVRRIVNRAAIGPPGPIGPAGLVWRGAWSGATAYVANDVVSLAGSAYVCILAHTNFTPPNATYWNLLAGAGTVTSVALTVPTGFTVAGSPVTTAGTLAVSESTQTANRVKAGPTSGGAAVPAYRALVNADMPAAVVINPLTAVGDLVLGGTAGAPGRLAIGAAGKALVSDGTTAAWQSVLVSLGAQTVGVTQVTIAHGLAYTPTVCIAQMTSAGQIWRSAASDGTNVYLTSDLAGRTCEVYVR